MPIGKNPNPEARTSPPEGLKVNELFP